jgi:hypothetical protein
MFRGLCERWVTTAARPLVLITALSPPPDIAGIRDDGFFDNLD